MEICWDKGTKVWHLKEELYIYSNWLYEKLIKDFDFEIVIYSGNNLSFTLNGNYPKNRNLELKKFFHQTYPFVDKITPMKYGITVKFKTKIKYL